MDPIHRSIKQRILNTAHTKYIYTSQPNSSSRNRACIHVMSLINMFSHIHTIICKSVQWYIPYHNIFLKNGIIFDVIYSSPRTSRSKKIFMSMDIVLDKYVYCRIYKLLVHIHVHPNCIYSFQSTDETILDFLSTY